MSKGSEYSKELCDDICAQLAEGLSLRTVCMGEGMPNKKTVFRWLRQYPDFLTQYTLAKQESADAVFEEIIDIADDGTNDWMKRNDPDNAGWAANAEHINRSRLRVDTRKWYVGKMKPKKYGDKLELAGNLALSGVVKHVSAGEKDDDKDSDER